MMPGQMGNFFLYRFGINQDGSYSVILAPGDYYIQTGSDGYYIREYWAAAASDTDCSNAESINVSAGVNNSGKDFQLELGGAISGTLYQTDGTTPITGDNLLGVTAFAGDSCISGNWQWAGHGPVNPDDGTYTIGGLPPGEYIVENSSDSNYILEWYANPSSTRDCSQGTIITVSASQTEAGKDFPGQGDSKQTPGG